MTYERTNPKGRICFRLESSLRTLKIIRVSKNINFIKAENGPKKYQIGLKTNTNLSYKRDTIASIMLLLALSFISEKCGISRIGRTPATQRKWISIDIKKWPQLFCYRMNLNEKWSLGLEKPMLSKPSFFSSSGCSNWFIWQAAPILFVTVGNGREDKKFYI